MYEYIENFKKLAFGVFIHFGLYSIIGKGEWILKLGNLNQKEYENLTNKFTVNKNWAKDLVNIAKRAGAKYITLTTRHHDGFSLYDTRGLNTYDAPHSSCGRDLVAEFTDACRAAGIIPFFYHTLLDWRISSYKDNFAMYIDYLIKSVEILCTQYGKIGGFWFDGMWDKPHADWQEERLYKLIRKYQPDAMIINNTGLSEQGKVGHPEIDSVTFERGKTRPILSDTKPLAGEMCEGISDHWGYAKDDIHVKAPSALLKTLVECRKNNCNFLLNSGLKANGAVSDWDKYCLISIGKWIHENKSFIYDAEYMPLKCSEPIVFRKEKEIFILIMDVPMSADPNVQLSTRERIVYFDKSLKVKKAEWQDTGEAIQVRPDHSFVVKPFDYGKSFLIRVARLEIL